MPEGQPLPLIWLLSDARNDAVLEQTLAALPTRSGFVFRHYHLGPDARRARFAALREAAKGHCLVLSGSAQEAREWGADGIYGPPERLAGADHLLRLATAHDAAQLEAAACAGADGVFLSPVFATRSHEGATTLGTGGFHELARRSSVPVIALGGMNAARAEELDWPRWGAIDGLGPPRPA